MKRLLFSRPLYIYITFGIIVFVGYMALSSTTQQSVERITTTVERGTVEQLVSVSGEIMAEQTAELAFPVAGIVSSVLVSEGDQVTAGDVLITLQSRTLAADRADAVAALARAAATRDELLAGADSITRTTSAETVTLRETTLNTIRATQAELIANARRTLLSTDVEAVSADPNETAPAPTITGTYLCDTEGSYNIDVYSSASDSGYSYRLTGLEEGTYNASVGQPSSFGSCGLKIQFADAARYRNTTWEVEIPNQNSSFYVANRNAYALAKTQAESAIAVAEQDVALARATEESTNAPARSEAIARANADIASANARIARIDAQIADRTMRAPFSGAVTDLDILPGETVTTVPVVTIVGASAFELTARIPEIDIGKLAVGQTVRAVFDARSSEVLTGTIEFISLQATQIDGVSYYEAIITLSENPAWLRSGLNADIDIIVATAENVLRVPRRFITETDDARTVQLLRGEEIASTTIDVILSGDDGFVALQGLSEGDTLVAP